MGMKLETTGEVTAYLITMAALQLGAHELASGQAAALGVGQLPRPDHGSSA